MGAKRSEARGHGSVRRTRTFAPITVLLVSTDANDLSKRPARSMAQRHECDELPDALGPSRGVFSPNVFRGYAAVALEVLWRRRCFRIRRSAYGSETVRPLAEQTPIVCLAYVEPIDACARRYRLAMFRSVLLPTYIFGAVGQYQSPLIRVRLT